MTRHARTIAALATGALILAGCGSASAPELPAPAPAAKELIALCATDSMHFVIGADAGNFDPDPRFPNAVSDCDAAMKPAAGTSCGAFVAKNVALLQAFDAAIDDPSAPTRAHAHALSEKLDRNGPCSAAA